MLFQLGETRSSLKADHLLQTPDTFIRTPLAGAPGVDFIIHTAPRIGAGFTHMTVEFREGGSLGQAGEGIERFLFVLEGSLTAETEAGALAHGLAAGDFLYLPAGCGYSVTGVAGTRAALIEKVYQKLSSDLDLQPKLEVLAGRESEVVAEPLGGDPDLLVRRLMPDGPAWDFAVNTMTYAPGAALSQVEVHVMEHGLLMLEGGGIYRLGDSWYPVTAGDFIWMAPYCPQWFGALGKQPAKYLIYKDWYRHPLLAGGTR
jgi:(S)-ureidoglycine aminohydrolase